LCSGNNCRCCWLNATLHWYMTLADSKCPHTHRHAVNNTHTATTHFKLCWNYEIDMGETRLKSNCSGIYAGLSGSEGDEVGSLGHCRTGKVFVTYARQTVGYRNRICRLEALNAYRILVVLLITWTLKKKM
jgi:hypothetical protein